MKVNASEITKNATKSLNEQKDQFYSAKDTNYGYIKFRDEIRNCRLCVLDWRGFLTWRLWTWPAWDLLWDTFSWISSGYGRRPAYTIGVSALIISLFAITYLGYFQYRKSINVVVIAISIIIISLCFIFNDPLWLLWGSTILIFSLALIDKASLLLSAAIFFSAPIFFSNPIDQNRYEDIKCAISSLAVIERALGWLLLAIFIVALNNVVI